MDVNVSSKRPRQRWFPYFSSYGQDGSGRTKTKLRRRALYPTPLSAAGISQNNDHDELPNHPSFSKQHENATSAEEYVNSIDNSNNSKDRGKEEEPIRDPHLMDVVGVHTLDTEFGGLQSDQRADVLESNRSWASGETPIEVLLHEEAMKQLNSIDMGVLCRIANKAHGRGSCTILPSMTRIGASNIVVFIAFDDDDDQKDGTRWVARFPLLGLSGLTDDPGLLAEVIDSMVTTMQYVSKHTSIPVPTVHHWNSTSSNELGRPYVLMDAARGNSLYELDRVGMDMEEVVKKLSSFVDQWAMYNAELASLQFERIGALKQVAGGLIGVGRLCTQENLHFTPLVEADNYRGPFTSVADYLFAMSELTTQGRYSTRNPTNKYSYHDFLHSKLIISMLPYYVNPNFLNGPFVLSHVDLDIQNILVDENNGFKITGIVDWDLAAVLPLQSHIRLPDMLLCDKWTMSRQQGKSISPWQLEFAQQYRSHYKLCLKKHLQDRQLDYPVDTLANSGYLFSRFQHAISEKPDNEGFDELWKHVYGSRLNWKDVIKGMETADWGTVMAERLSLPVPAENDDETSETDKDVQSRPETNDTFIKFGTQDPKLMKRISNKLRWSWWHVEQCLLCRMSSKRIPVLMRDGRGVSAPPSSVGVMLTDYRKTGEENEVEQTKEV